MGAATRLRDRPDDPHRSRPSRCKIETGSLYPALHRLEKQGWVKADWKQTEANQRAKFYRLTPKGKKQLLQERDRWSQLVSAIGTILNPRRTKG